MDGACASPVFELVPVEGSGAAFVPPPAAGGLVTVLDYQLVGDTRYFDAAGFAGRTFGLSVPKPAAGGAGTTN